MAVRKVFTTLVLALAIIATAMSRENLYISQAVLTQELPPVYLPEVDTIRLVTLGFDPFFSDIIWFSTVNYFGKQFRGSGDYRWLKQRCDLVLKLQPKAKERFDFCATLLAWVVKDVEASNQILGQAIEAYPEDWRFYYLRGFNYWYFQNRQKEGADELTVAASLPGSPSMLPSLTARLLSSDPAAAVQFLTESLRRATDPSAKEALTERLLQARLTFDLIKLTELVTGFKAQFGKPPESLEELKEVGFLKFIPKEPFGGQYILEDGVVVSTSGKKGLELNLTTPLKSKNQSEIFQSESSSN